MLTRKTQYAWMALGGLICLFGLVLASKLRDGNKAIAQPEPLPPPALERAAEWGNPALMEKTANPTTLPMSKTIDLPATVPANLPKPIDPPASYFGGSKMIEPEKMLPPKKKEPSKAKEKLGEKPSSEPKATLEMPFPGLSGTRLPAPSSPPVMKPSLSSIQPASFGPNTPTAPDKKSSEKFAPLPGIETKNEIVPNVESTVPAKAPTTRPTPATIPAPSWDAPAPAPVVSAAPSGERDSAREQPGEPPLAPNPGPVQFYHAHGSETLRDIARRTLGSSERAGDLHKLNPSLKVDEPLASGATVRLPGDACVQSDDAESVKPLPVLHAKPAPVKAKAMPLTGTYQCSLDEKGQLTLPRTLRDQLGGSDTVLVSPGPDKCLWLTNRAHLERLGERLEQSHANEADVRVFKRLYFAQTEKLPVNDEGRVAIPERLGQFAGLHQEVVLIGIDDHFEVWDAARWRSYTQQKSSARAAGDGE